MLIKSNLSNYEINSAYKYCLKIAKNHYENFPVASLFLPKKIRYSVASIYAFAREADDISDEGDLSSDIRIKLLDNCWKKLESIQKHEFVSPSDPIYFALKHTIETNNLPMEPLFDLLIAFKQDVTKNRYNNFKEILEYCRYSANPVGRLLLHLTKNDSKDNLYLSDNICTALQLINFLQDIYSDLKQRNRCYMPLNEMLQFGFTLEDITNKNELPDFKKFITLQTKRAEQILCNGKKLGKKLNKLFGLEIRLIIAGGETIINALYNRKSIYHRPKIKPLDWIGIFCLALQKSKY